MNSARALFVSLAIVLLVPGCAAIPVRGQVPDNVRIADIRPGMGGQEAWDLLGKPADVSYFPERAELVFSWRYVDIFGHRMFFNVHLDRKAEKVLWTTSTEEMRSERPD